MDYGKLFYTNLLFPAGNLYGIPWSVRSMFVLYTCHRILLTLKLLPIRNICFQPRLRIFCLIYAYISPIIKVLILFFIAYLQKTMCSLLTTVFGVDYAILAFLSLLISRRTSENGPSRVFMIRRTLDFVMLALLSFIIAILSFFYNSFWPHLNQVSKTNSLFMDPL
jgi:hypothetical protein